MTKPVDTSRILHFEFRTMDAALKMVESLVTQGCQAAIAPQGNEFTVTAPSRPGWTPPPASGVAA
jgi:hypothetical protein